MTNISIEEYIQNYSIPADQATLLKAAQVFYDDYAIKNNIDTFGFYIRLSSGPASASFGFDNGQAAIKLPEKSQSGSSIIPVSSVAGYSNTFMTYDTSVAAVHETNHIILGALGMTTLADQELPVAALAAIGREAIAYADTKASEGSTGINGVRLD